MAIRKEDYDLMHALESNYWWFVGMRQITGALLSKFASGVPRNVLDAGCGTGINLLWMLQQLNPERLVGCDYSATALAWCRDSLKTAPDCSQRLTPLVCQGDVRRLPFAGQSFDLVTSFDVLDNFDPSGEDSEAFAEIHRVLGPGGIALIREPAYQWLMSSHDVLFETKHRYTTTELREKMSRAGFQILVSTYANTVLFPLAAARRLMRKAFGIASDKTDTQPLPNSLEWLNGPLRSCLQFEAFLMARGWSLPFGLSAICIGCKINGQ